MKKDDYKKIEESFLGARNYANELLIYFLSGKNTKAANKFASELADTLKSQTSAADQLTKAVEARKDYIEESVKSGKFLNKGLLKQLDTSIKLLELEKEKEEVIQEQLDSVERGKDLIKQQNTQLKESLGFASEVADLLRRWCSCSWCKSIYRWYQCSR